MTFYGDSTNVYVLNLRASLTTTKDLFLYDNLVFVRW